MRIGVLADTHHPLYTIPTSLLRSFETVDLIVHAGDFCDLAALRAFESIGPVVGVLGNQDDEELKLILPTERCLEIDGKRILVIHGHQGRTGMVTASKAARRPGIDCVVFGHSHQAYSDYAGNALLFNPGSPTWARFSRKRTFGILVTAPALTAEIHEI